MAADDQWPIWRRFSDLPGGQVHWREAGAGTGRPLLLLHGSPGSSAQMIGLIAALAPDARVIAPDTPGFGDSAALPLTDPAITDFAAIVAQFLDVLGLGQVDVYGFHTGACIAVELALMRPDLVDRVIVEGVGLYENGLRDRLIAHYAHPFVPDQDGSYLIRAFQFLRDQSLYWPWFDKTAAARRDGGMIPAQQLHAWLVEVLKAAQTYHLGYRAAFRWDARTRLALLDHRVMVLAAHNDPLCDDSMAIARQLSIADCWQLPRSDAAEFADVRRARVLAFLDAAKP